jgi:hypothetical protein
MNNTSHENGFLARCADRYAKALATITTRAEHLTRFQTGVGLAVLVLVGFWMSADIWGPGLPAGLDMARHFWRARVLHDLYLPAGHVDGWSPYWHLGLEQFLFQSYGYYLVMALSDRITLGFFDFLTTFKFYVAAPLGFLPLAAYLLSRSAGLHRASSVLAGFVVLSVTVGTGFGVKGWFAVGLLLQGPGILLIALVLALSLHGIPKGGWYLWAAALGTGAALVTHFISGAYLLTAVWIYAVGVSLEDRSLRPIGRAVLFAIVALALSAHSLDRTIALQDFMGQTVGWGKGTPIIRVAAGEYFAGPVVSAIGYLGAIAAIVGRRRGVQALAWMFVLTVFLVAGPRFELPFDILNETLNSVFRPRSMPAACLVFPVLFAYGIERLLTWTTLLCERVQAPRVVLHTVAAIIIIVPAIATVQRIQFLERIPRHVRAADSDEALPFETVIEWLQDNVESPAVVGFEMDAFHSRESGSPRFASLLNDRTGLFALGGDQSEATDVRHHRMTEPDRLTTTRPQLAADALRRLSVSHVIVRDPVARERLRNSSDFIREFSAGTVEVFSIPGPHQFASGPSLVVHDLDFTAERVSWEIENRREDPSIATLAVSRHPNWQALLDGEPLAITETRDKLLSVQLPTGRHHLEVQWVRSLRERACNWISFLTLGLAIVQIGRRPRAQQPPDTA